VSLAGSIPRIDEMENMKENKKELRVVGAPLPKVVNRKPPLFASRIFSPISYILYLWYSSILSLVS